MITTILMYPCLSCFLTVLCLGRLILGSSTTEDAPNSSSISSTTLQIWIHRNGEVDPCGTIQLRRQLLEDTTTNPLTKYQVESLLTVWMAQELQETNGDWCTSTDNATAISWGLYGYCDMGPKRTPQLLDYDRLVPTRVDGHSFLPCRWHTREGLRITKLSQLLELAMTNTSKDDDSDKTCSASLFPDDKDCSSGNHNLSLQQIHLYGVPAGRLFVFAPSYIGEVFELKHVPSPLPDHSYITMTVLCLSPRILDVHHVFTHEEADQVIQRALTRDSPQDKLQRSTTHSSGAAERKVFSKRTSENAFDSHGAIAMQWKQRILQVVLGIPAQDDDTGSSSFLTDWMGHDDGLQILRYNQTTAYNAHWDYLEDDTTGNSDFDFDSSGKGGNRLATVLLYLTDVDGAGGETVFPRAKRTSNDTTSSSRKVQSLADALIDLRATGDAERAGIAPGSWQETMVADCRRHFAVQPYKGRSVLFYSQFPNGQLDTASLHGGCPVLSTTNPKWAANLWIWSTPRQGHPGAPQKEGIVLANNNIQQLLAVFKNTKTNPKLRKAELWYDEGLYWGPIGYDDPPMRFNTYQGHRWNVRVDGKIVQEFVIGPEPVQEFLV